MPTPARAAPMPPRQPVSFCQRIGKRCVQLGVVKHGDNARARTRILLSDASHEPRRSCRDGCRTDHNHLSGSPHRHLLKLAMRQNAGRAAASSATYRNPRLFMGCSQRHQNYPNSDDSDRAAPADARQLLGPFRCDNSFVINPAPLVERFWPLRVPTRRRCTSSLAEQCTRSRCSQKGIRVGGNSRDLALPGDDPSVATRQPRQGAPDAAETALYLLETAMTPCSPSIVIEVSNAAERLRRFSRNWRPFAPCMRAGWNSLES